MSGQLANRVGIVTGATGGMGRVIVRRLAAEGCSVVAADTSDDGVAELLAACEGLAGAAVFELCDVSSSRDVRRIVARAVEEFGRLDCAVNAAAIEFEQVPLAECDDDDFQRMMAVNSTGVFLCMKHELRAMIDARNGGSIVNIASTNSYRPQADQPAYTASKHAVLGLTKSAAIDYARHHIRVNAITPGAIDTPMLRNAIERRGRDAAEVAARLSRFRRFGNPEEIAEAALWLCSDASSFTTGHALAVDGGMLAG